VVAFATSARRPDQARESGTERDRRRMPLRRTGSEVKVSGSSYQIYFFDRESGELTGRVTALPGPIVYLKYSRDRASSGRRPWSEGWSSRLRDGKECGRQKYLLVKEDSDYKTAISRSRF